MDVHHRFVARLPWWRALLCAACVMLFGELAAGQEEGAFGWPNAGDRSMPVDVRVARLIADVQRRAQDQDAPAS